MGRVNGRVILLVFRVVALTIRWCFFFVVRLDRSVGHWSSLLREFLFGFSALEATSMSDGQKESFPVD